MVRTKLPSRRRAITKPIVHNNEKFLITFGFDDEGTIREAFCADPRVGSDIHALLTDSCILLSLHLQTGAEIERLTNSLGENRAEGEKRGPPSSIIGAIARAIVELQNEVNQ